MNKINNLVNPLLTDLYQITMSYSYWKNKKHNDYSVFDLYFRKNPFEGEYCILAGLDQVISFVNNFKINSNDIEYLKTILPNIQEDFWIYLLNLNYDDVIIYSQNQGEIVFPKEPLLRIEGPLLKCQLLETTLLCLINFPSLVCTNASRMKLASGDNKSLLEFGLRRAQGPDGGISASRYSFLGGFDGTSNVLAAKISNINCKGTHAHSYVMSYNSLNEIENNLKLLKKNSNKDYNFYDLCINQMIRLNYNDTNKGELAAFISYAYSFPDDFLALIDTYDTLESGIKNFIIVAYALYELDYIPIGIRLDSGDLSYLSKEIRKIFIQEDKKCNTNYKFKDLKIVASNDINEKVLYELKNNKHEIDIFGIGTNLVTCQSQPALGCVYKLVELNNIPRIKISQQMIKSTMPFKKSIYRLYDNIGTPILDLIQMYDEKEPLIGKKILCHHPNEQYKKLYVTPFKVRCLLNKIWDKSDNTKVNFEDLKKFKEYSKNELNLFRDDHKRILNPTPYKVSVSTNLLKYLNNIYIENLPIKNI